MNEKNKILRDNLRPISANIAANLKEFGYTDVTDEIVVAKVERLLDGQEPDEIIGMLAKNMLIENNLLEDDEQEVDA